MTTITLDQARTGAFAGSAATAAIELTTVYLGDRSASTPPSLRVAR